MALDNAGHTSVSSARSATVPAPVLTIRQPAEGSIVQRNVEVVATADPEKASHTVGFERSVAGGQWTAIGQADSSSPAYTVTDSLAAPDLADGTEVRYRATVSGPGFNVVSGVRTVLVGAAPQPESVTVAGSLNSEMGCPDDWQPACRSAFMTLDPASRTWKLTSDLPAGQYEFKAAINGSWDENYGQDGAPNGSNMRLTHGGGPVTFRYDHTTHVMTAE